MNEREYRLFEYGILLLGWLMTMEWFLFCLFYNIPLKGANLFAFLLIGIASMTASLTVFVKHVFFVQEMQAEIEKHRNDPILPNNDGASEK